MNVTVRGRRRHFRTVTFDPGRNAVLLIEQRLLPHQFNIVPTLDFRQTAPVRRGPPFIYPHGDEWVASERVLTMPLPGIGPTMIARAGGLDQGNIILNLQDAEQRGLGEHILFLAGSAINSIKNTAGKPDARLGAEAMQQALEIHRSGKLSGVPALEHLEALIDLAARQQLKALREALRQRSPENA